MKAVHLLVKITLSLAWTVSVAPQEPPPGSTTADRKTALAEEHLGLRYSEASRSPRRNTLDLYLPKQRNRPPLVMFVHGGTWMGGSKDSHKHVGRALAAAGLAAAVINYRLFPFARWPDFAEDGAAAFAWLLDHADQYGFDADRMFLMGHSAGGHIAAALAYDQRWLAAHGRSPERVRGFIGLSGVYDVRPHDARLSHIFGPTAKTRTDASPFVFAGGDAPPSLLFWADNELKRLDASGRVLAARLRSCGVMVETHELSGESHTSYVRRIGKAHRDVISQRVLKFIESAGEAVPSDESKPATWAIIAEKDLRYKAGADADNTLDLYRPDRTESTPLLAFVHGGDWTSGDKSDLEPLARACARLGLAVACVNHPLAPAREYPAAVRDVAAACKWLHANADELGFDPHRINLGGIGSGGQLALVVGLDRHWLDQIDAPPEIVGTVAALSTPCDVRLERPLFNDIFGDDAKLRELASPNALLHRGGPQVMLTWCDGDPDHVVETNRAMPDQLEKAGQRHVALEISDQTGPGMLSSDAGLLEMASMLAGFFDK